MTLSAIKRISSYLGHLQHLGYRVTEISLPTDVYSELYKQHLIYETRTSSTSEQLLGIEELSDTLTLPHKEVPVTRNPTGDMTFTCQKKRLFRAPLRFPVTISDRTLRNQTPERFREILCSEI